MCHNIYNILDCINGGLTENIKY